MKVVSLNKIQWVITVNCRVHTIIQHTLNINIHPIETYFRNYTLSTRVNLLSDPVLDLYENNHPLRGLMSTTVFVEDRLKILEEDR